MRPLKLFLAATFSLMAFIVHAAGFHLLDIPGTDDGPALKGAVWYPCAQPSVDVKVGPYVISVAKDFPVVGSKLPLVVLSHGWSGSYLGHRDIAETLADGGFVVAAINHGDSAMNPRRNGDPSVLIERPVDIRRVIDFMLGAWPDASRLDAERVGFFGFSRGGYTGLVAIGANPVLHKTPELCENNASLACVQAPSGERLALTRDPRIKAAVIADPLGNFFTSESWGNLKQTVPVQLWSSEHGGDGVTPESVAAIARELPTIVEFHVVPGARHFDFLLPCPTEIAKSAPDICSDSPGFDRAAFHKEMDAKVLAFFRKNLVMR